MLQCDNSFTLQYRLDFTLILLQINCARKLSTPVILLDTLKLDFNMRLFTKHSLSVISLFFLFYYSIISLTHYRINPVPIKIVVVTNNYLLIEYGVASGEFAQRSLGFGPMTNFNVPPVMISE